MAEPTQEYKDLAAKFEADHKKLFIDLIGAGWLNQGLYGRAYKLLAEKGGDKENPEVKKAFGTAYSYLTAILIPHVSTWVVNEMSVEKSGATPALFDTAKFPGLKGIAELFLTKEGLKYLQGVAQGWDKDKKGTGFIPLIIWGVIALIGYFTVHDLTTKDAKTIEAQKDLVDSTNTFCSQHGLSQDDCKKMLSEQTQSAQANVASGGPDFFTWIKWALFAGAAFWGYNTFLKKPARAAA